jgi:hypothetical protein
MLKKLGLDENIELQFIAQYQAKFSILRLPAVLPITPL